MARTFNANPYFDDFDENKNFHRILFKPGFAVQARELTQAQTILQDQITKFGNFIFRDGSKVSGANIFVDTNVKSVRLTNVALDVYAELDGLYVIGVTSQITGLVVDVNSDISTIAIKPITNISKNFVSGETLYFYNSKAESIGIYSPTTSVQTGTVGNDTSITVSITAKKYSTTISCDTTALKVGDAIISNDVFNQQPYFVNNTTILEIIDTNTLRISSPALLDLTTSSITFTRQASRNVLEVGVTDGVFFSNGIFVKFVADKIVPSFDTQYPSLSVGLYVVETVVDSYNDSSLLDPAQGSYNYTAPGADRYQIYFELITKPVNSGVIDTTDITNAKYIELVRLLDGKIQKINNTATLGEIEKTLARRTKDQSGSFVVSPFNLILGVSAETDDTIPSYITAGKAYVNGYEFETVSQTPINIEKSRDTNSIDNYILPTYYGSYIQINNYSGTNLDFFGGNKVLTLDLHNTTSNSATSSTKIGTAIGRNIVYDRGSNSNQIHNLYLYNVELFGANTSANIKSIISSVSAGTFSANANTSVIYDSGYDSLLFEIPNNNIQNISNFEITNELVFDVTFSAGNTTIQTATTNQQFLGGTGSVVGPERNLYYSVVITSSGGSYAQGTFIPMDSAGVSINISQKVSGTKQDAVVSIGNNFNGTAQIKVTVIDFSPEKKIKTLVSNAYTFINITDSSKYYSLGKSDIYSMNAIYEIQGSYKNSWSSSTTYNEKDHVIYDSKVYFSRSNSNLNNIPSNSLAWQAVPNSMSNYYFDNGQRDTHYDHGRIKSKITTTSKSIVCVYNYFTHGTGSYISFESYTSSGAGISYSKIPTYTSDRSGKVYKLRDCIDFRPRRSDSDSGTSYSFGYNIIPFPTSSTSFNYSFYLNRIDKLVISDNKQFNILKGVSSYSKPIPPKDKPDAMTVATINIPAFTYNVSDISIQYSNHKRYTMDDIGALEKRISNLEYYTTLSLLEKEVAGKDVTNPANEIQYKNGFIVDSFSGHGIGDYMNPDYNISIDNLIGYARPSFRSNIIGYNIDDTNPKYMIGSANTGSLISFPFTETPFITQTVATGTTIVNSFNVISYTGTLKLTPESDIWYDTQQAPIVQNTVDNTQAFTAEFAKQSTVWGDFKQTFTGVTAQDAEGGTVISTIQAETSDPSTKTGRTIEGIKTTTQRTGTQFSLGTPSVTKLESDALINTQIVQYAREATIKFEAHGLSPFTKLYVYGNDTLLSGYVTPTGNPKNSIQYISVTNKGTGYTTQPTITVDGANTTPATATAYLDYAGGIKAIKIINPGEGYSNTINSVTISGGNGSGATANASTIPFRASDLISDKNGSVSGILTIPNDSKVKFPTGKIRITVCDNPEKISQSGCYASADFRSEGIINTSQKTITSILNPVLKSDSVSETTTTTSYVVKDVTYVPRVIQNITNTSVTVIQQPDSPPISYNLRPDKLNVNEGDSVTFTLTCKNVAPQTNISYSLSTATGNIGALDLDSTSPGQMTGNFVTRNDGTAIVRFTLAKDLTSESEVLTVLIPNIQLDTNSINYVTVSDYIQPVKYHLDANTRTVSEGNSVMFTLTTEGIQSGNIAYTVSGTNITSNDFTPTSQGQITGNVVVTVNSSTGVGTGNVTFTMNADSSSEGTELMTLNLTGVTLDAISNSSVTIVDTSVTPTVVKNTYYITSTKNEINEGQSVSFFISTTSSNNSIKLGDYSVNNNLNWKLVVANTNWSINGTAVKDGGLKSGMFVTGKSDSVEVLTTVDSIDNEFTIIMQVEDPSIKSYGWPYGTPIASKKVTVLNKGDWKEKVTTTPVATKKHIVLPIIKNHMTAQMSDLFTSNKTYNWIWNNGQKLSTNTIDSLSKWKGPWRYYDFDVVVDGEFYPYADGTSDEAIRVPNQPGIHPDGDAYGGGNQYRRIGKAVYDKNTNKTTIRIRQYHSGTVHQSVLSYFRLAGTMVTYTDTRTVTKEWDPTATPPSR